MKRSSFPLSIFVACALAAPVAQADVVTLGSDLQADATIIQANQADTAFWPSSIKGSDPTVPADGQILSIRVKGIAIQPDGAAAPLNEFHFQTLDPEAGSTWKVYLSSQAFDLPYTGDANQINEYKPTNLCAHKGGLVDFNDEGGWDGTGTGPYRSGVPFRIFGRVANSSTNWFSKDNGTKNGAVLAPPSALPGVELLLQYTLATGDDRSYECGGPLRDESGKAIPSIKVTPNQDSYVSSDGKFTIFGYCGNPRADCTNGTATVTVNGQQIAAAPFSGQSQKSIQIPMQLAQADFAKLAAAAGGAWTATVTMASSQGTATDTIKMHTKSGGVLHVVTPQRVYVRGNRVATPAAFCGLTSGCSGTATLAVKGKVVARTRFAVKKKGLIRLSMRVPASIFRQLKRKPVAANLSLAGPLGTASGQVLLRH